MRLRAGWGAVVHHGMRAYYLALAAGLALALSAFLPWVSIGATTRKGMPGVAGFWILGLGLLAAVFAILSIITRKNSRHPILVVGLAAVGIMFLAWKLMERSAIEQAWAMSQARAIVDEVAAPDAPRATIGSGIYLGLGAAAILVLFGLTIVVRRVKQPYAEPEDDDV